MCDRPDCQPRRAGGRAAVIKKDIHGEYVATCNECGAEEYGGVVDDFRSFVRELKDRGWVIHKDDDDEWIHLCDDCG